MFGNLIFSNDNGSSSLGQRQITDNGQEGAVNQHKQKSTQENRVKFLLF